RRIGAGAMQYRLQARYRRQVTGRYLELPVAWHQQHATGTLLSNANADIEAAWYPIAPLPFAVATIVMLAVAVAAMFGVDWALALPGRAVGWVLADAPRAAVGWERVSRVLSATGDMRYGTETPAGDDPVDLSFDGVGYAYPGGGPVLHDVTFKVPAGATVALV